MSDTKKARHRAGRRFFVFLGLFFVVTSGLWFGFWTLGGWWLSGLPPVLRGLAALVATLLLVIVVSLAWGQIAGRRRPDVFGPFNEALRRIAQGDYSVKVPTEALEGGGPAFPFATLAENLNAMTGSLAKVEELRRQFVADVSHEFQSPLTSVLGFAQALRSPELPMTLRERYLSIIETEARRLSHLADTLLRLNGLEDRTAPPEPTSFRLDVQLRRVLVAAEPQWSAKRLEVDADLATLTVVGNEELWTQVWTNLVHNAIKFTPAEGKIMVRLTGEHDWCVEIEDTGIGLSPEEIERVFERFYKADSARTHGETTGSGLGLALVQRIVQLHGARVEAVSPGPGRGTTLRVSYQAPSPPIQP